MSVNEIQHGGDHYKTGGVEHWDLVEAFNIPYLEGCASKYVARWRRKNGVEDLKKAQHFLQKRRELMTSCRSLTLLGYIVPFKRTRILSGVPAQYLEQFYSNARLDVHDQYILNLILLRLYDLEAIDMAIFQIGLIVAEHTPGSPEDGGHHSKQG